MRCGRRQLFIYYRVAVARAEEAVATAVQLQRSLCGAHPGLQAGLLRRPATEDPHTTLMETYALDAAIAPDGIDPSLQAHIEHEAAAALGALIEGARHVEVFEPCA